jgi:hypothetical protein
MYYPSNNFSPVILQPVSLDQNQINNKRKDTNKQAKNADESLNLSQLSLSTSAKPISHSQANLIRKKHKKLDEGKEDDNKSTVTDSDDESQVEVHESQFQPINSVYLSGFHPFYDVEMDVFALQCCTCCINRCSCCRPCDNFVSCPIYCWVIYSFYLLFFFKKKYCSISQ